MYYYIFGITDKGNYREQNEDCILIDHEVINSGSYDNPVITDLLLKLSEQMNQLSLLLLLQPFATALVEKMQERSPRSFV